MTFRGAGTFAILLISSSSASAHGALEASNSLWNFDPWVVVPIGVTIVLFAIGTIRLGRRNSKWRVLLFAEGAGALVIALVSPLHWFGEHSLTFHMIEHEALMLVAAPLLALAKPIAGMLWALPRKLRWATGRVLRHPAVLSAWKWSTGAAQATFLHGAAIWAWHLPPLFDLAVANVAIHRLQHLSFFLTALVFWWSIFRKTDYGAAAWHLFITMIHTSILGALMALAPNVLYVTEPESAVVTHLNALQDQQLAGLIMWVPGGTIYGVAALVMLAYWIQTASRGMPRDA